MNSEPGTYTLILRSHRKASAQIGRLRQIDLEPGYYLYVGSAFGPGGVHARVARHCRRDTSHHWHIDHLREFLTPVGVWYSHDTKRLEHRWAQLLGGMRGMSSIQGFGCSDCTCYSHLFLTSIAPDFAHFSRIAGAKIEAWLPRERNSRSIEQR